MYMYFWKEWFPCVVKINNINSVLCSWQGWRYGQGCIQGSEECRKPPKCDEQSTVCFPKNLCIPTFQLHFCSLFYGRSAAIENTESQETAFSFNPFATTIWNNAGGARLQIKKGVDRMCLLALYNFSLAHVAFHLSKDMSGFICYTHDTFISSFDYENRLLQTWAMPAETFNKIFWS